MIGWVIVICCVFCCDDVFITVWLYERLLFVVLGVAFCVHYRRLQQKAVLLFLFVVEKPLV